MDPTMSVSEPFYPDPEGILHAMCELCGTISIDNCMHALTAHGPRVEAFVPGDFYEHPEWPQFAVDGLMLEPEPEPMCVPPSFLDNTHNGQPLANDHVRQLNENATTIQPITIREYIKDIYLPGDRIRESSLPRGPSKRQPVRPDGFPCSFEGCTRTFSRSCDLKRHQKTHLIRSERPHKCSFCNEGFLYPKDRNRHERTHNEAILPQVQLYCPVPGCTNVDGFSRRDNLLRHQRKQHPQMQMSP